MVSTVLCNAIENLLKQFYFFFDRSLSGISSFVSFVTLSGIFIDCMRFRVVMLEVNKHSHIVIIHHLLVQGINRKECLNKQVYIEISCDYRIPGVAKFFVEFQISFSSG